MKAPRPAKPRRFEYFHATPIRTPESTGDIQPRQLRRVPYLKGTSMTIHIRRGAIPADDCTLIPTAYTQDVRLSLEARGVLAWLLCQPATSEITEDQIIAAGPDDRNAVRKMLGELESNGYLRHETTTYVLTEPSEGRA